MEKKVCSKCGEEKMITEFNFRDKELNIRRCNCRECQHEYNRKYQKKWVEENKDCSREYGKRWREKNKEKRRVSSREYGKSRFKVDPMFKLKSKIRNYILISLRKKGYTKKSRSHQILGCSYEEFKVYIESKFESWMSWDNFGVYNGDLNYGWDIDHIIPLSSAETEEDVIRLNHYTNLQPLCSRTNRHIKRDRLDWSPE